MSNTKISTLPTVGYKAGILVPGVDTTLPVANQNVNLLASSLAGTGGGGGASSISDLTDASDLTGTAYALVGFDKDSSPAVVLASKTNTFVMFGPSGALVAQDIATTQGILGLATPVASSFSTFDASAKAATMTIAQAQAALGMTNATLTASLSTVTSGTITLSQKLPADYTIASMDSSVASGSFAATIALNGTAVGGLSAVAVASSTNVNTAASAPQAGKLGDKVTLTISATTGPPSGGVISLNLTRP